MGPAHPLRATQDDISHANAELVRFAGLTLDFVGRTLLAADGRDVSLTPGEFRLLCTLVRGNGRILSRDQLLDAVVGRRAEPFDRSIGVMIGRLRRKIEPNPRAPHMIATVVGFGYKFAAPVQAVKSAATLEFEGAPEIVPRAPERRHITALAVELLAVEKTNLPADPEESQALIAVYRKYVACVVARYGGVIKEVRGRQVTVFFGYPLAQEHLVEHALHAALELVVPQFLGSSTRELSPRGEGEAILPNGLAVRVGAASGLVITESAGEVLGETPGEATRLLTLAEPGQVIIAAGTRRLSGSLFAYRDIGPVTMKGVADRVHASQVLGPSAISSRSEALYGGKSAPLVGRVEERILLLHAWRQVKSGEGRTVLLTGEPGIGKSRLLVELETWLARENHASLRYFCSPLHQESALYPIITSWQKEAGFARGDTAERQLRKLETILVSDNLSPTEIALLAAMLAIPTGERYARPDLSPRRRRELTFAALQRRLASVAQRRPVLMLFEDVQWIDHSSLELLDMLVSQITKHRILLVISFRPEFGPSWIGRAGVSFITLTRLDQRQATALAMQVAEERSPSDALTERIIAQTDGVPLFIEEMTKAILEAAPDDSPLARTIPSRLQALLMARLDRFTPMREIAQMGAAIGREFSYELVAAVAPMPKAQLDDALARLCESGLAFRRGMPPDAIYTFKHALVQDAAYDSLLKSRRQELHGKIARVIEQCFPSIQTTEPEVLAHHLTKAGRTEAAVPLWQRAGELASQRIALREAIAHLNHGLELVATLPHSSARDASELGLRSLLGTAWLAFKGWPAAEVSANLRPALALAKSLRRHDALPAILFGLAVNVLTQGRVAESLPWAQEMLDLAIASGDADLRITGYMIACICCNWLGEFTKAVEHADRVLDLYDDENHRHLGGILLNPKVVVGVNGSWSTWILGYPDRAMRLNDEKDAFARRRDQPLDLGWALMRGAHEFDSRCSSEDLRKRAEECDRLGRENSLSALSARFARKGYGQALVREGKFAEGIALLKANLASWEEIGGKLNGPTLRASLAEATALNGDLDEALRLLDAATAQVESPGWGERYFYAEILRLKGWILLLKGDLEAAEQNFLASLHWARRQQAKMWELRTATSLARLWQSEGKRQDAYELLSSVYDWFTEGFDTKDLQDAKSLLAELAQSMPLGVIRNSPRKRSRQCS